MRRIGPRWLYVVLALVACAGLGYLTPSLSARWRRHRVENDLAGVEEMLKAKDYKRLVPLISKAYQADSASPQVLRALAQLSDVQSVAHPKDAVHYWRVLVEAKGSTLADHLHYISALARAEELDDAKLQWDGLSEQDRGTAEAVEVRSQLLCAAGKKDEAATVLRRAVEVCDDQRNQLRLSQLEVGAGDPSERSQARLRLWGLAHVGDENGWRALRTLAALSDLSGDEATEIANLAYGNSQTDDGERRSLLLQCVKVRQELSASLLEREAARQKGKKLEESGDYFAWMAKMGRSDETLRTLGEFKAPSTQMLYAPSDEGRAWEPNALVFESSELFGASTTALIYARRWRDLVRLLGHQPSVPYSGVGLAILHALCAQNLHEPDDVVDGYLKSALKGAEQTHDERDITRIIAACQQLQRDEVTAMACEYEYSQGRRKVEMLKTLFTLALRAKQTNALMSRARLLRELAPELGVYAHELDYLRLLTGTEMELTLPHLQASSHRLGAPEAGLPEMNELMLALGAYRVGDLRHCREFLDDLRNANLPRGAHAVLAGLLASTGQREAAFYMALKISPDRLLNEEKRFLDMALQPGATVRP